MCIPVLAESSCVNSLTKEHAWIGDCLRLHRPCGQFGPDHSLRLVGMTSDNSKVFLGDYEAVDKGYEICDCEDVTLIAPKGSKHCPISPFLKPNECAVVLFVGIVVLPGLLWCLRHQAKSKEERDAYAAALYWGYDFCAGICALKFAATVIELSKDPFSPFYWTGKFIWATLWETITFDLPLQCVKTHCCASAFFGCLTLLGTLWGYFGIIIAYQVDTVIMMGHHVLVCGLIQWLIDIVKGVGWRLLKRKLCGSGDSSVAAGYEAFQQEMMHPIPEQA